LCHAPLFEEQKDSKQNFYCHFFGVGQHAGMSDTNLQNYIRMGGSTYKNRKGKPAVWEIVSGSTCKNIACKTRRSFSRRAGQHAGMVGQHKQE
jgi:hypothetical protein